MVKARFNKNYKIGRVVTKIAVTVISLWVGGLVINVLGGIMNQTASPFYKGLQLIGWTVSNNINGTADSCYATAPYLTQVNNCITDVSGAGILAVIGLLGIASIVMEFVEIKM